jgi:arylsulfatase A-like enzyme
MNRSRMNLWIKAWVWGAVSFCLTGNAVEARDEPLPNLLVILTDDHGYADLPAQGLNEVQLPNLQKLTESGVRFTQGYVSGSMCSPSRAGLLSGRYQQRFGHENNACQEALFKKGGKILPESLKAAGYASGMFGKWHLGEKSAEYRPTARGFDVSYEHRHYYRDAQRGELAFSQAHPSKQALNAQVFAAQAVKFIQQHEKKPWFVYLALHEPHVELLPTPVSMKKAEAIEDAQRRTCMAALLDVDEAVGMVQQSLTSLGLEKQTLICFLGDNGAPLAMVNYPPKGSGFEKHSDKAINGSRNAPLRGLKGLMWEGAIRVPMIMSWPGKLPAGQVYTQPVISLDIAATALALAGLNSQVAALDGVDLMPYLLGEKSQAPHEQLCWRDENRHLWAIRQGDWKLVQDSDWQPQPEQRCALQLFDLAKDPEEKVDVAAQHPDKVLALKAAWEKWNAEMIPPVYDPAAPNKKGGH